MQFKNLPFVWNQLWAIASFSDQDQSLLANILWEQNHQLILDTIQSGTANSSCDTKIFLKPAFVFQWTKMRYFLILCIRHINQTQ